MTDVKVLRKKDGTSRRMAFIGYSSVGDAVKAKEWFDSTWLRGSRIKVDFALPVSSQFTAF
jgi:multiple RNA-binding domain-containing protein 1